MADETPVTALFHAASAETAPATELALPAPEQAAAEPSPDAARAVEALFAQQQENRLVAGLLGLWTGALVMHDLAVETFSKPTDEDEPEPRKKKKAPPREPTP